MIAPSDEELLRVWEENLRSHPVRGALHALVASAPERGWQGWAQASIGERDRALLELNERLFGSELRTTAACPQCGERLESEFPANDIRSAGGPAAPSLHLHERGFDIDYRLPTSEDLLHIAAERSEATSDVEVLLRRCVSRVLQGEVALDASSLPDDVIERITDGMAKHDPDADVRIALECPVCQHTWDIQFDIVSYFWSELDDWAQHTLSEVHALASAYGWTEHSVLALSAMRRRIYLDMVGA